jgi:peptide/nickel transport system permease protein
MERERGSKPAEFITRLWREKPLGVVGLVITLVLLLTGIFAGVLAPYGFNDSHVVDRLSAPSVQYWLGTDNLGRDLLSRVIFGARISVIVGLCATSIATVVSTVIGISSGYIGGKFDLVVQRFVDAWMCFPGILLLMVVMSVVGVGMLQVIIVLGLLYGINSSRVIRSATISVKENVYVQAAIATGCSTGKILIRHVLPNVMAPIIILFTTRVPDAILTEAALSFLGFGIPPPAPSWGGMLSGSGRSYMLQAPWMVIWPGLSLAVTVYGMNIFGDAVRDLLDPRLRRGVGRFGQEKVKRKLK